MTPTARTALLHFLVIGGLAALGARWLAPEPRPEPIVIDEAQAAAGHGAYVDDEILYREALVRGFDIGDPVITARLAQNAEFLGIEAERGGAQAARGLGLARGDLVVRRRLVQRMRAEVEASARADEPTASELADYRSAHAARFETPRRVSFQHVCFSRERRADAAAEARAALGEWRHTGKAPVGDGCLAPSHQPLQTEVDLVRYFGAEFGRALFEQPQGEWAGPLPAPGASHLVRVSERRPAHVPPLSEMAARVRAAVQTERAEAAVRAFLAERRTEYEVSVAGVADAPTPQPASPEAAAAAGR